MTTGALIFAVANGSVDYESLARWNADNIQRHLGIPTHIVTQFRSTAENSRWFHDTGHVAWHNQDRCDAYDISPWDRTLLLDADYIVATDTLKSVLCADQDLLAHRQAYDITGCNDFRGLDTFGAHNMPMWWATVIMFRRSPHAKFVFDAMRMVRDNWNHYRGIYKISQPTFRNDHALSIALLIADGNWLEHAEIPWPLATLTPEHDLAQIDADHYRVDFINGQNKSRWLEVRQDFHAMGKKQLEGIVANHS